MRNKLLFCNIGWMNEYRGITDTDKIINGGKYVEANNVGGEIFNFKEYNGEYYGYVQPKSDKQNVSGGRINIDQLGASPSDESIDGINVIFTAKGPKGTVIIGFYKNATVYREKQIHPYSDLLDTQGKPYGYRFKAKKGDVRLLPVDDRTIPVPRATGKNGSIGGMGQSPVWYAKNLNDEGFFTSVDGLLNGKKPARKTLTDSLMNKFVEKQAVKTAIDYFSEKGYEIKSVESENVGWDLEATLNETTLLIEVKGLSSKAIYAGITPNEYKAMKNPKINQNYRLCIVTECHNTSPLLSVFALNIPSQSWIDQHNNILIIEEKTAAMVSL